VKEITLEQFNVNMFLNHLEREQWWNEILTTLAKEG